MTHIMINSRRSTSVLLFAFAALLLIWHFKLSYVSRHPTREVSDTMTYNSKSATIEFRPGTPKASPYEYSRTLVIGKLSDEDTSWIARELPGLNTSIYRVDAPASELRIPKNKGHEAMVYLTYIIDHYDELADTTIFLHPHQTTWHNNDILDSDAAKNIQHLSDAHVARVGYFNTRCHHEPGCPDWLRFDRPEEELDTYRKMEEKYFTAEVWKELHPDVPVPQAVSQPCCAQFAVSRDRVRHHPRSEYVRYRDWLLNTKLDDIMSGRVMEYSWQYLFTGKPELCPEMHVCYCDGYGICFGGPTELQNWFDMREESRALSGQAAAMYNESAYEKAGDAETQRNALEIKLQELKIEAFERGKDPRNRAAECGRAWKEGDEF
jgi:hypothetical protein